MDQDVWVAVRSACREASSWFGTGMSVGALFIVLAVIGTTNVVTRLIDKKSIGFAKWFVV